MNYKFRYKTLLHMHIGWIPHQLLPLHRLARKRCAALLAACGSVGCPLLRQKEGTKLQLEICIGQDAQQCPKAMDDCSSVTRASLALHTSSTLYMQIMNTSELLEPLTRPLTPVSLARFPSALSLAQKTRMEGARATRSACYQQLPTALQLHIVSFLPPNARALSGRLVSPDARDALSGPDHCTASLSQPLPPHAVPWAVEAGQQHVRQLPFWHKLQLLCTAAASGSEVNLEVTRALLQPSVFPELLQSPGGYPYRGSAASYPVSRRLDRYGPLRDRSGYCDAGVAAVQAGHPQLLGWLLRHCPGVVDSAQVLEAAAQHCSLEGLQVAYAAVQGHLDIDRLLYQHVSLCCAVLAAAASSATPDALGKVEWLLSIDEPAYRLSSSTAAAAARSGDLGRLQWLRERGCPMGGSEVLQSALEHAGLAVAQWLVGEGGSELPPAGRSWREFLAAAAKSAGGVVKLQWLRERGAPALDANEELLHCVAAAAIAAGQVQVAQHLWTAFGGGGVLQGGQAAELAGRSGSIPMLAWLRQAGVGLSHTAYEGAGAAGSLPVVRWLAQEAGVSAAGMRLWSILQWPSATAARSRELLQAVQLVVAAGYSDWGAYWGPSRSAALLCEIAKRGDLALVQYLRQQQQQVLQRMQQQLQQQEMQVQQQEQEHWQQEQEQQGALMQQQQQYQPQGLLQLFLQQLQHWSSAEVLSGAVEAGCEALLEWVVGQPGSLEGVGAVSPYLHPAKCGDLGTLTALRRLGVPWGAGNVVAQAVREGCSEPALRWLVEQGAPVGSEQEVEQAARDDECSSPVRAWMGEQGWPVDGASSEEASDDAAGQGGLWAY